MQIKYKSKNIDDFKLYLLNNFEEKLKSENILYANKIHEKMEIYKE